MSLLRFARAARGRSVRAGARVMIGRCAMPSRTLVMLRRVLATSAAAPEPHGACSPVPFGVGERLEYDVRFGKLRVGSGSMEVADVQTVRGRSTPGTRSSRCAAAPSSTA